MSEFVIMNWPPNDGRDWHCQCARCGSSCDWQDCEECEDGFVEMDFGDDVVSEFDWVRCPHCKTHGGWWRCMSSTEYCEGNPIDGRETIHHGEIEWYTLEERKEVNGG